jgi:protein-S-isoprenylcysteine O-methyltransferase Ste14
MKFRFTPPDYILVIVILQILFHFILPVKQIISSPYIYLGILLIVIGQIPNFSIFFIFRKFKTTIKSYEMPKKLVTSGLFKVSRNPIYLGMALTLFGVAVLLGSLITFVFPVVFIILTDIFVIPVEERNLEKAFGKKYRDYKRKVRRWI